MRNVIRIVLALCTILSLSAANKCGEGTATGTNAKDNIRRPITTTASWYRNFWMDITVIIDGKDAKGPFEKKDGYYSRTWDMRPGQHIEIIAKHHKDMDPPPGDTVCKVMLFGNPIAPDGLDTQQNGTCHASATVPPIETQG